MKAPSVMRVISVIGFLAILPVPGYALTRAMAADWTSEVAPDRKPVAEGHTEWLKRAIVLEKKKDWQLLLDWCRLWADSESENVAAWYNLGITYYELKRYNEAVEAYRQAMRIDPGHAAVWTNLGAAYHVLDRYNEAIEAYRQAIRIDPKDALAWYNLGDAYGHSGNNTAALGAVRELRRLDPALADKLFKLIAPR